MADNVVATPLRTSPAVIKTWSGLGSTWLWERLLVLTRWVETKQLQFLPWLPQDASLILFMLRVSSVPTSRRFFALGRTGKAISPYLIR